MKNVQLINDVERNGLEKITLTICLKFCDGKSIFLFSLQLVIAIV